MQTPAITFLILLLTNVLFAQDPKEVITISEIIREAISYNSQEPLVIENKIIKNDYPKNSLKSILSDVSIQLDSNGYIIVDKEIRIENSVIDQVIFDSIHFTSKILFRNIKLDGWLNFNFCAIDELHINTLVAEESSIIGGSVNIRHSNISHFQSNGFHTSTMMVEYSEIGNLYILGGDIEGIMIEEVKITNLGIKGAHNMEWLILSNLIFKSSVDFTELKEVGFEGEDIYMTTTFENGFSLSQSKIGRILIENCDFGSTLFADVRAETFTFKDNTFLKNSIFEWCDFSTQIHIQGNDFQNGVSLSGLNLYDRDMSIKWSDIENKLTLLHDDSVISLNHAYQSEDDYLALSKTAYHIYTSYKNNGNLVDANNAYKWLRNFEGLRLGYLYQQEGGFNNYLRWRLNSIMRVYTEQGTSPTRAISISIYIILGFAVFYFFFPSEWDTTSKGKLISNYRDFTQRNDKGYVKPFFAMIGGFTLSLINAITLSLNSFVTLGFGTIPTSGLARYICILQGFIGWFLLSIFTVALINQVLA